MSSLSSSGEGYSSFCDRLVFQLWLFQACAGFDFSQNYFGAEVCRLPQNFESCGFELPQNFYKSGFNHSMAWVSEVPMQM